MNTNVLSFENLPQAVSLLLEKVDSLEQLLKSQQTIISKAQKGARAPEVLLMVCTSKIAR